MYETGNTFSIYKSDGGILIISYEAVGPMMSGDHVLWGKDVLRPLYWGGRFDLNTGKMLTYTNRFWGTGKPPPLPTVILANEDVAADWNNYVLMWNKEKKIFEVEDINTGKIVKTYKKFW